MKSIQQQLIEALDDVAKKDKQVAQRIHEQTTSIESKLATARALLDGAESAPDWRATGVDKIVREIRESSSAFRPTIRKHNGALDNARSSGKAHESVDPMKLAVAKAARGLGLTEAEAKVFAGLDEDPLIKMLKEAD